MSHGYECKVWVVFLIIWSGMEVLRTAPQKYVSEWNAHLRCESSPITLRAHVTSILFTRECIIINMCECICVVYAYGAYAHRVRAIKVLIKWLIFWRAQCAGPAATRSTMSFVLGQSHAYSNPRPSNRFHVRFGVDRFGHPVRLMFPRAYLTVNNTRVGNEILYRNH